MRDRHEDCSSILQPFRQYGKNRPGHRGCSRYGGHAGLCSPAWAGGLLFLGSAVYAAGIDEAVKAFVAENSGNIGTIVNFSTAAVAESTCRQVQKLASTHRIPMSDREFHCRGAFAFLHRGRPNAEELRAAAAFAKSIVNK